MTDGDDDNDPGTEAADALVSLHRAPDTAPVRSQRRLTDTVQKVLSAKAGFVYHDKVRREVIAEYRQVHGSLSNITEKTLDRRLGDILQVMHAVGVVEVADGNGHYGRKRRLIWVGNEEGCTRRLEDLEQQKKVIDERIAKKHAVAAEYKARLDALAAKMTSRPPPLPVFNPPQPTVSRPTQPVISITPVVGFSPVLRTALTQRVVKAAGEIGVPLRSLTQGNSTPTLHLVREVLTRADLSQSAYHDDAIWAVVRDTLFVSPEEATAAANIRYIMIAIRCSG